MLNKDYLMNVIFMVVTRVTFPIYYFFLRRKLNRMTVDERKLHLKNMNERVMEYLHRNPHVKMW